MIYSQWIIIKEEIRQTTNQSQSFDFGREKWSREHANFTQRDLEWKQNPILLLTIVIERKQHCWKLRNNQGHRRHPTTLTSHKYQSDCFSRHMRQWPPGGDGPIKPSEHHEDPLNSTTMEGLLVENLSPYFLLAFSIRGNTMSCQKSLYW